MSYKFKLGCFVQWKGHGEVSFLVTNRNKRDPLGPKYTIEDIDGNEYKDVREHMLTLVLVEEKK